MGYNECSSKLDKKVVSIVSNLLEFLHTVSDVKWVIARSCGANAAPVAMPRSWPRTLAYASTVLAVAACLPSFHGYSRSFPAALTRRK